MYDLVSNCLMILLVSAPPEPALDTGIPPSDFKIKFNGKKNQNSFIRKLAFLPNERYAANPRIKSQLDVCGATHMTHLSLCGTVMSVSQRAHFNMRAQIFIKKLRILCCGLFLQRGAPR